VGSRPAAAHQDPIDNETDHLLDVLLEAGLTGGVLVAGDEMLPTLQHNDQVIVAPFLGLPRPGQIVMARTEGFVVVRRLTEVRMERGRRRYCLRADAAPGRILACLREDLSGRVIALVRQGIYRRLDDSPSAGRRALRRPRSPRGSSR
jgi:phage repressor protein C with HTH and peptisase S24 domain